MSAVESPEAIANLTLAPRPAQPTFAQHLRLAAMVTNALLIGVVGGFLLMPLVFDGSYLLWSSVAFAFLGTIATFTLVWIALVSWREVRVPWIGPLVPLVSFPTVLLLVPVTLHFASERFWATLAERIETILLIYTPILGLTFAWGFRLYDSPSLTKTRPHGKVSKSTLVALAVTAAVYGWMAHYCEIQNIMGGEEAALIAIAAQVATVTFVVSLTGYLGWWLTVIAGALFHLASSRLPFTLSYFSINDTKCVAHYEGTILLFTAAMTLPWLLLGWRIVWTPPLWDRSWRKPNVTTGEAT